MAYEWRKLCRGKDISIEDDDIVIEFRNGRKHRVTVEDDGESYRFTSFVTRKRLDNMEDELAIRLWKINRMKQRVGFRLDKHARVVGESWVPKAGLQSLEFMNSVRHVAVECDRLEFLLTGKDDMR